MDNKKVASELVKMAKQLTAGRKFASAKVERTIKKAIKAAEAEYEKDSMARDGDVANSISSVTGLDKNSAHQLLNIFWSLDEDFFVA